MDLASTGAEILGTITDLGYWATKDPIGKRVDKVLIPCFDLQSTEALELLKLSVLDNKVRFLSPWEQMIVTDVQTAKSRGYQRFF